jgi:hypothetical protein
MNIDRLLCIIGLLFFTSCAGVVVGGTSPPEYPHAPSYGNLGIPPGHLPPPGECRIWYPGIPPGQQPPPGSCYDLGGRVPPGAWLIHGVSKQHKDPVRVSVYHDKQPRVVVSVRYYDFDTGRFIREEKAKH